MGRSYILGHGIVAAFAEWVATSYSLQCQPATTQGAVAADCFGCVLRAAGGKAAMIAEKWAEQELVASNQDLKEFCHNFREKTRTFASKTCCQAQVQL